MQNTVMFIVIMGLISPVGFWGLVMWRVWEEYSPDEWKRVLNSDLSGHPPSQKQMDPDTRKKISDYLRTLYGRRHSYNMGTDLDSEYWPDGLLQAMFWTQFKVSDQILVAEKDSHLSFAIGVTHSMLYLHTGISILGDTKQSMQRNLTGHTGAISIFFPVVFLPVGRTAHYWLLEINISDNKVNTRVYDSHATLVSNEEYTQKINCALAVLKATQIAELQALQRVTKVQYVRVKVPLQTGMECGRKVVENVAKATGVNGYIPTPDELNAMYKEVQKPKPAAPAAVQPAPPARPAPAAVQPPPARPVNRVDPASDRVEPAVVISQAANQQDGGNKRPRENNPQEPTEKRIRMEEVPVEIELGEGKDSGWLMIVPHKKDSICLDAIVAYLNSNGPPPQGVFRTCRELVDNNEWGKQLRRLNDNQLGGERLLRGTWVQYAQMSDT
tara:strand:+ start:695 stop:2020 length:1326 start_codon:yes stop_codon:yes gene_type:complete